jgi:hypothetical protein
MRTLALAAAIALLTVQTPGAERPNILFIMSDDHGAHAIGAYGSRVNRTPNLDPGDHNTRAHYGVRTRTHKLIYFWKKDGVLLGYQLSLSANWTCRSDVCVGDVSWLAAAISLPLPSKIFVFGA